ncbi:MAG: hypothetical protein NZ825_02690, partial [Candidatus Marinimicrobia bacterium]|nr:hypothetical protein [Candidatus Neomarinimicrobiota bacterium]
YWNGAYWSYAFAESIHDNQRAFDYCYQQGILENKLCKKLYEKVKINEKIYTVMNINYAINNWRGEQKDVVEAIEDLVGTGASTEGFNKVTNYEYHEKDDAGAVIPKDIFSIEYPDDPQSSGGYEYDWYWNWGNGTSDPKEQESEFYHEWQTDSVLEKFVIWLAKAQACTDCPAGYEGTRTLANTNVYFFENIHYAGKSDVAILATIEGVERNWCLDSSRNTNGLECLNFKVRDKSVYQTDEGRKAYTVEYEFVKYWRDASEPLNFQIKKEPKVYTATEIHDGNNAWHISTLTHKDIFDKNPDQFYHFIESFRLVDYNTPVSTVTIPKTPEPTPVTPEPTPAPVITPEEPEPTPEPTTTSASFKKYTDDDSRFTIEYLDDWVLAAGHPDSKAAFDDQYDWRTNFQVFLIEDDSLNNRSDSKVLRAMERNHWETCKDETFTDGTRKCSDFKAVDSDVFYTNDNRKVYFVKTTYTMEFSDYLRGQEHSFVKLDSYIFDDDNSWEMAVESYEQVADAHYDKIIHMMKSFSLK